jgi:FixJ family two-component response regulator
VTERDRSETMIFVIDDDDAVRDSLKILLESHSMTVREFGSAQEFLDAYEPHPRCCLILDLNLPVMGGLDFLSILEANAVDVPTIMVTGRGDDAIRDRALAKGAVAFLEKPVTERDLVTSIARALELNRESA